MSNPEANMKYIVLLFVLLHSVLALENDSENEKFVEFVISPRGKYFDSDGKTIHSSDDEHHRAIRDSNTCRLPSEIKDYLLVCKSYPNRMVCVQICPFGTTFNEGIQREMKCWYEEDRWTPHSEFEFCKPFVDCTLTLRPGGNYVCYTQYLDKGNECEISCDRYEDKRAVPLKLYKCDINGNWTPKLPDCVQAGSGLELVPPPKGQKMIEPGKGGRGRRGE